jgi:hypothetical protein
MKTAMNRRGVERFDMLSDALALLPGNELALREEIESLKIDVTLQLVRGALDRENAELAAFLLRDANRLQASKKRLNELRALQAEADACAQRVREEKGR